MTKATLATTVLPAHRPIVERMTVALLDAPATDSALQTADVCASRDGEVCDAKTLIALRSNGALIVASVWALIGVNASLVTRAVIAPFVLYRVAQIMSAISNAYMEHVNSLQVLNGLS